MVPLLPLPAFGGTPWRQIWPQFRHGFRCYLPSDGTPAAARSYLLGDDDGGYAAKVFGPPSHAPHDNCDEGFLIMNAYCLVGLPSGIKTRRDAGRGDAAATPRPRRGCSVETG